jgi:hypothetical protein
MRIRAFCMGYEPVRLPLTKAIIDALMREADICILAPRGVPIGGKVDVGQTDRMRCVAHEHHGKIVVLEAES